MTPTNRSSSPCQSLLNLARAGALLLLTGGLLAGSAPAQDPAAAGEYQNKSLEELEEIVGPFALYPDELIRYILPASTHQEDMLSAAVILNRTSNNPKEDDPEVAKLDESVQALLPFPQVVQQFAQYPDWLGEVGDAVAYQQGDVMDAIQLFRKRSYDAGNLETTEQQTVIVEQQVIRVVAANPQVIYVPVYQPVVVVEEQDSDVLAFGLGIAVGALIWNNNHWGYWGGCHWHGRTTINIHGGHFHRHVGYRPGHRPRNYPNNRRVGRPGARSGIGPGVGRPGVRGAEVGRPGVGGAEVGRPGVGRTGVGDRPRAGRPNTGARPKAGRPSSPTRRSSTSRPSSRSAFSGSSRGSSARTHSSRGASSRGTARRSVGRSRGRGRRS